jgi:hypothetical protein
MATRETPTLFDADNTSGSSTPAACNEWRNGDADSMSARAANEPITDAGYTTAGFSLMPSLLVSFLYFGVSPYRIVSHYLHLEIAPVSSFSLLPFDMVAADLHHL